MTSPLSAIAAPIHLLVDIEIADTRWHTVDVLESRIETALAAALVESGVPTLTQAEISVLLTDDAGIRQLNSNYRDIDKATDVLSFPQYPDAYEGARGPLLGDLVLSYDRCRADADERALPFGDHVVHLLIHGLLHLFGYDHMIPEQANRMEQLEVRILAILGLPNPYVTLETDETI